MTDSLANTQKALRHILDGNSPNGVSPADCGPLADVVTELYQAHAAGGTEAARRVFEALSRRNPELTRLASGPDLQPETAPALSDTGEWLDTRAVLQALERGETGDAELLTVLYTDRLAFDHAEKQWFLWTGGHWARDARKQAGNLIANQVAAQYLHTAAELKRAGGDDKTAQEQIEKLYQRAASLRYRSKISNVLDRATSQPALALAGDEWEPNPMLLAVANGVIDLTTSEFRPGRPADFIRSAAPVAWQGLNAPAPRWEQFLSEIFAGDSALIDFMQRLLGYALAGQVTEHVLPILWGQGRNGKETLLETIKTILGELAAPAAKDVLMDSQRNPGNATPHLYALRPLRLAWVSESKAGARLNAEQVKWLTGGGTITARPLHGSPVTFTPRYTLMLITNHKPKADSDDYALWKRLLLIPFTESFIDKPIAANEHKADSRLAEKLKAEGPGILAWLVRGCLAWQREGLNPPPVVTGATEVYQQEEDDLAQFVEECCLIDSGNEVKASHFYAAYFEWAKSYKGDAQSKIEFGKKMSKRFRKDRAKDGNGLAYYGVGLLNQPKQAEMTISV